MFSDSKRKFLFRCDDCEMILAVSFEEPEDLENIQDNKIVLECPCTGKCRVLKD